MAGIKKADIILIIILAAVAAVCGLFLLMNRTDGGTAAVLEDGEEVISFPLNEDTEYLIEDGDESNLLVIKDGKASITEANCPDCVCVRTGEIQYEGQTIVCLPHDLVIRIEGGESGEVDSVSQ